MVTLERHDWRIEFLTFRPTDRASIGLLGTNFWLTRCIISKSVNHVSDHGSNASHSNNAKLSSVIQLWRFCLPSLRDKLFVICHLWFQLTTQKVLRSPVEPLMMFHSKVTTLHDWHNSSWLTTEVGNFRSCFDMLTKLSHFGSHFFTYSVFRDTWFCSLLHCLMWKSFKRWAAI